MSQFHVLFIACNFTRSQKSIFNNLPYVMFPTAVQCSVVAGMQFRQSRSNIGYLQVISTAASAFLILYSVHSPSYRHYDLLNWWKVSYQSWWHHSTLITITWWLSGVVALHLWSTDRRFDSRREGAQHFCPKNMYEKLKNARILHDSCPKSYQNTRIFMTFARKISKIPEFYTFLARKWWWPNFTY